MEEGTRMEDAALRDREVAIDGQEELRGLYGPPMDLAVMKQIDRLDRYARQFIARSPFLCMATSDADGNADVSPRGDPNGFVQVLDDHTLAIPDRPGNNRIDSMSNVVANPKVGLLFFVPGIDETLRVNGQARIVRDEAILARCAINGRVPKVVIAVSVEQVFFHCAKALKRSRLWDVTRHADRRELPSLARIIMDQASETGTCADDALVDQIDQLVEDNYRTGLY
jgi:PPOX class probable FMN-dependent enzyme